MLFNFWVLPYNKTKWLLINTLNIHLVTFGQRSVSSLTCFAWSIREFRIFQHHTDVLQSLIRPPVYAKVERKKEKKNFGYLFIWPNIDRSSTHVIGCCKQPVKCAILSVLVISEDISTFLTHALFIIILLHSSDLSVYQYVTHFWPGHLVPWVSFFFFWFLPAQKILQYEFNFFRLIKIELYQALI